MWYNITVGKISLQMTTYEDNKTLGKFPGGNGWNFLRVWIYTCVYRKTFYYHNWWLELSLRETGVYARYVKG